MAGLTFILAGGAILAKYGGHAISPWEKALVLSVVSGLWLVVAIYFLGDISAHFNPAATLSTWWIYLIGPVIGAVGAVGVAYVLRGPANAEEATAAEGTPLRRGTGTGNRRRRRRRRVRPGKGDLTPIRFLRVRRDWPDVAGVFLVIN